MPSIQSELEGANALGSAVGGAATILDVAHLAGVSRTTVSRVLNEPERVTSDTVRRVRDAAAQLNYHPSAAARTLRSGRTGTVALIVGDVAQPFHAGLAQAIAGEAEARGMTVALHDLAHSEGRLVRILEKLPAQGVDAAIIATADSVDSERAHAAVSGLVRQGIPVVATIAGADAAGVITLRVDYAGSAHLATSALADAGARSIALMVGRAAGVHASHLRAGYLRALAERAEPDIAIPLELDGGYDFATAREVLGARLASGDPIDAIVVATIPMAIGAVRAAEDHGLRVPEDLGVICCEEVALAAQLRPSITTIAIDAIANGHEIMRLLGAALSGVSAEPVEIAPTTHFRDSFAPPPLR